MVDGKQRFEAMFEFYEDKLPLLPSFVFEEDIELKIGGLKFSQIRFKYPDIARKFENFNLSVMRIVTDEEGKINDLFVRLNRSRPLTGAELRAAMMGESPKLIKTLSQHPFFQLVKFNKNRAQDQNAAAKILLIEFLGGFTGTAKGNLDDLVGLAVKSDTDLQGIQAAWEKASEVLSKMCNVFVERDPLLSSQGSIPVYYWLVRNTGVENLRNLRQFLLQFEEVRKRVRASDVNNTQKSIQSYYIYNTQLRSVDNKGSLEIRYSILSSQFLEYLKLNGV
jgi:hypothetical protein